MGALLIKDRARKPLENTPISLGWYPSGVSGMYPRDAPCVLLRIGEHTLFISEFEWERVTSTMAKLIAGE